MLCWDRNLYLMNKCSHNPNQNEVGESCMYITGAFDALSIVKNVGCYCGALMGQ